MISHHLLAGYPDAYPRRVIEVEVQPTSFRVAMQVPGVDEAEWPDIMLEWQPEANAWFAYVHPDGDEVAIKLTFKDGKVKVERDP